MDVKQFLNDASVNAAMHIAEMKANYAQLKLLDQKTKTICLRFLSEEKLEPVERELMADQLVIIQRCRAAVVEKTMELGQNI